MSNRKSGEIPDRRKPKVSLAMNISQGLGGPKLAICLKQASSDGQTVNIPSPQHFFNGRTELSSLGGLLDCRS